MRMKDVAQLSPSFEDSDINGEVSFVPMDCLRCDSIEDRTIEISQAKSEYTYFANDDILMAKVTPCFENGNIAIAENLHQGIGFGSSEIFVLRHNKSILNRFLFYLLRSSDFRNTACASMRGVGGLKRITPLAVITYEFNLPPLAEQRAIADYLDKRCNEIDRRLELLNLKRAEYLKLKTALINRTVTRGLNANVKLKESGIQWIGEIPEHWEVKRIQECFEKRNTKVSDQEYEPLSVTKNGILPQLKTVAKTINGDDRKLVLKGDFVVNSRSDRKGSCGISSYDGSVTLISIVLKPIYLNGNYCHYLLRCNDYVEEFYRFGKGIVADLWTTSCQDMMSISIPFPPLAEQRAIADYLDEQCGLIDAVTEKIEAETAALTALKSSLISETVTGKRAINTI